MCGLEFDYLVLRLRLYLKVGRGGRLVWKANSELAGRPASNGYAQVSVFGATLREHRAVWIMTHGTAIPDGMEVDHINGKRLDNRPSNLRLVTREQNQWNARKRKDNTSGVKGVAVTRSGTYAANISVNGKVKYLGAFKTIEEAEAAYNEKALELRGEYVPKKAA